MTAPAEKKLLTVRVARGVALRATLPRFAFRSDYFIAPRLATRCVAWQVALAHCELKRSYFGYFAFLKFRFMHAFFFIYVPSVRIYFQYKDIKNFLLCSVATYIALLYRNIKTAYGTSRVLSDCSQREYAWLEGARKCDSGAATLTRSLRLLSPTHALSTDRETITLFLFTNNQVAVAFGDSS